MPLKGFDMRKKFIGFGVLLTLLCFTMLSCDHGSSGSSDNEYIGTGPRSLAFVNQSRHTVTISPQNPSDFREFTIRSGRTITLRTQLAEVPFAYGNSDLVYISESVPGRIVFSNRSGSRSIIDMSESNQSSVILKRTR